MEKKTITFRADGQILWKTDTSFLFASNIVSYINAVFTLDDNWTGFDAVRAVWKTATDQVSMVLDEEGKCEVPAEVLRYPSRVLVNLVGSNVVDGELQDRLTTYPCHAFTIDQSAHLEGSETPNVTPSQFEQYVSMVKGYWEDIHDYRMDAEAWAVGERNGEAVSEDDDTYQNNSKYYAEQSHAHENESKGYAQQALEYLNTLDEHVADNVDEWLVAHPEATTTVDFRIVKKTFHSVFQLISDTTLKKGDICQTLGFYSQDDGGATTYIIGDIGTPQYSDESDPHGNIIKLLNGLYATAMFSETIMAESIGCKSEIGFDNSAIINDFNFANTIVFNRGIYEINTPVIVTNLRSVVMADNSEFKVTSSMTDAVTFTYNPTSVDGYQPDVLIKINVDCNNLASTGVKVDGLRGNPLSVIRVYNHLEKGVHITNRKTTGSYSLIVCDARRLVSSHYATWGLYCESTDGYYGTVSAVNCLNGCKFGSAAKVNLYHPWRSEYPQTGEVVGWYVEPLVTISNIIMDAIQVAVVIETGSSLIRFSIGSIRAFGINNDTSTHAIFKVNSSYNVQGYVGSITLEHSNGWYLFHPESTGTYWRGINIGSFESAVPLTTENVDSLPGGVFDIDGGWIVLQNGNSGLKRAMSLTSDADEILVNHYNFGTKTERKIPLARKTSTRYDHYVTAIKGTYNGEVHQVFNGMFTSIDACLKYTPDAGGWQFEFDIPLPYKHIDGTYYGTIYKSSSATSYSQVSAVVSNNVAKIKDVANEISEIIVHLVIPA